MDNCCMGRLTQLLDLCTLEGIGVVQEKCFAEKNYAAVASKKQAEPRDKTSQAVVKLARFLKSSCHHEGIFRISGSKCRQEALKNLLKKGTAIEATLKEGYTIHDYATVLKLFLSDYTDPLLAQPVPDCYRQVAAMDSITAKGIKIEALQILFFLLPPSNRFVLQSIMDLLSLVAKDPTSRMTSYSLAVVFAPNIIFGKKAPSSLLDYADGMEPLTELVAFIISNIYEVFQVPQFLQKFVHQNEDDAPPTVAYCQQVDARQVQRVVHKETTDALLDLYAEMMEMPDGPQKKQFVKKFRKMHPGTPPFIPQSKKIKARLRREEANSPSLCQSPLLDRCSFDATTESFGSPSGRLPFECTPPSIDRSRCQTLSMQSNKGESHPSLLRRISNGLPSLPKINKPTPDIKRKFKDTTLYLPRLRSRTCSRSSNCENDPELFTSGSKRTHKKTMRSTHSDVVRSEQEQSQKQTRLTSSSASVSANDPIASQRLRTSSVANRPPLPKPSGCAKTTDKHPHLPCENIARKRKLSASFMELLTSPFSTSANQKRDNSASLYIKPCLTPLSRPKRISSPINHQ